MKKLTEKLWLRLAPGTLDLLRELAARDGRSVTEMARILIDQGLVRRRPRVKPGTETIVAAGAVHERQAQDPPPSWSPPS